MKIAFLVNNYPPRTGGVELHVQALARELRVLGHESLVVTLGPEPGFAEQSGIEVLTLREHFRVANILGFPGLGTKRKLRKLLKSRQIDVVSVHTRFFPMSYVGYRAAASAGVPVIHTEHGSDYVASDSPIVRIASRCVDHTLGRLVLRGADAVLGVSEEVCAFVRRLAGRDAELFYNAIDIGGTPTHLPLVEPEMELRRLVFVGRLVPGKGWDEFLQLIHRQRAAGFDVVGDVVGDGPDMMHARNMVDELGLQAVVTIHGRKSQREVREILRGAVLVNPTRLSEGFQTTLLEAIAEGAQVVTYPVPGAARLLDQGGPVWISEDRTLSALDEALQELRAVGPKVAPKGFLEAWSWPRRAEEYLEVMRRVGPSTEDN